MGKIPFRQQILKFLEATGEKLKDIDRTATGKAADIGQAAMDKINEAQRVLDHAVLRAADRLLKVIMGTDCPEGDNNVDSTPWVSDIEHFIDVSNLNPILSQLGFNDYKAQNAVDYIDQNTKYWKITEKGTFLEDLRHFGVPRSFDTLDSDVDRERLFSSLAHKDFARSELMKTVSQPLPKDTKERDKIISFQTFILKNSERLLGKLNFKFPRQFYRELAMKAVENKQLVPLVLMFKFAKINLKDLHDRSQYRDSYARLVKTADANFDKQYSGYWK